MVKKTTIMKKGKLPITSKYYYRWQIDEYRSVKKKHGKTYADNWFENKYGR